MKKYNEDYFSVIEKRTGRKIADCGEWTDARMLLHLDPQNREIRKNKFLMGNVVDVEIPKQLPTTAVVRSNYKPEPFTGNGPAELPQIKLPQGEGKPVVI